MKDEDILKETHALKSDLNGLLLLTNPRSGLSSHPDEDVRRKAELLKNCIGHILMRVRNIETHLLSEKTEDFDDYYLKFNIPKPKNY